MMLINNNSFKIIEKLSKNHHQPSWMPTFSTTNHYLLSFETWELFSLKPMLFRLRSLEWERRMENKVLYRRGRGSKHIKKDMQLRQLLVENLN